jgi:hypothetical protein
MELFSLIVNLPADFAKLARALLADGMRLTAYPHDPALPLRLKTYFYENNSPSTKSAKADRNASTMSRALCWPCFHTVSRGKMPW